MATLEAALTISQALLTPTIAVVVAWIAWQQLSANREKLKLDKYERRLKVYAALNRFIGAILIHANMKGEDLARFDSDSAEAEFLFGDNNIIRNYLHKVRNVALSIAEANAEYSDYSKEQPPAYNHEQIIKEKFDSLRWLADQHEDARNLFKPYLTLEK